VRRYAVIFWMVIAFSATAAGGDLTNDDCLACHGNSDFTTTEHGKQVSLYVDAAKFQRSAHQVLGCTDCHSSVTAIPHAAGLKLPSCGSCHSDEGAAYARSVHGKAVAAGNMHAPECSSCHGNVHALLPVSDPTSAVAHRNIPGTCGSCHKQKFVMQQAGVNSAVYVAYEQSVHGKAVAAGSEKAAVCSDCHGSHAILAANDPSSFIFKFNVPATCGKCHTSERAQYVQSVHGIAIANSDWSAPVCTDCHGIHSIQAPVGSAVAVQAVAEMTCARCHQGVRLTREYGVPSNRVSSYLDTYHGLASKLGSTVVANCASCHGSHLILASSNPLSPINKANLATTCGKCHPGATAKFTRFPIHGTTLQAGLGGVIVRWIRDSYIAVLIVVLGLMILHNGIIWRSKLRALRNTEYRPIIRMTHGQRLQHLILLISFAVLVITGFALLSPFSRLADAIGLIDPVRRLLHRVAGITLIGTGVAHIVYVGVHRGGRRALHDLLPDIHDLRDATKNIRYHLGLSGEKPAFGRFTYAEKLEYWALVWGTFIMAVTGLMMWFQVQVTGYLSGWTIDAALTIHYYEAILATFAILIWHFYQVMLDPDVYPMNWAWWDGRMSLAYYRHEHAGDVETIASYSVEQSGDLDENKTGKGAAAGAQEISADSKGPAQ
jgi:cytochrome b subunit of formate dehydrogenase